MFDSEWLNAVINDPWKLYRLAVQADPTPFINGLDLLPNQAPGGMVPAGPVPGWIPQNEWARSEAERNRIAMQMAAAGMSGPTQDKDVGLTPEMWKTLQSMMPQGSPFPPAPSAPGQPALRQYPSNLHYQPITDEQKRKRQVPTLAELLYPVR